VGGSLRRPNDANSADYPSFRSLAVISVPILPDPDDDSRSLVETLIKEQARVVLTPAQDQACSGIIPESWNSVTPPSRLGRIRKAP
jgi:hypothetical protein